MTIVVCPLSQVEHIVAERAPSHMITLLDPSHVVETPKAIGVDRHLRLGVNDIVEASEGLILADEALVRRLIDFSRGWDEAAPMLIHCWAGISRSTASAFILACERNPDFPEERIARALRRASASAYPNRRFIGLADDLLGRRGRMVDAIDAIGRPDVFESRPFDMPVRYAP